MRQAAFDSATDPFTWLPALGALGLQIGHADRHLANSLRHDRPIFGSTNTAKDVSNYLSLAPMAVYAALGLGAPDAANQEWSDKGGGFSVGAGAIISTVGLGLALKSAVHRQRPDGSDHQSFPSGHTSLAAVNARLASDVLNSYNLSSGQRLFANAGLIALTATTGWARIEAGKHHPADVLAGAALGNFVAGFATRAFLHAKSGAAASLQLELTPQGASFALSKAF